MCDASIRPHLIMLKVHLSRTQHNIMTMKQHYEQHPVVGGIYRDKSGSSLVVVDVVRGQVLLEYANGTITSVDDRNWQLLHPQISVY